MNTAGGIPLVRGSEALDAGRMVNMATPKGGDQNGSVEELFHSRALFGHFAKAIFAFPVEKIGDRGVRGFSLVDPDAKLLLEHDILADRTQSDAFTFRFQVEGIPGSELQAVAKGLGQNDAAGFIEGELSGHNGIMEWEKPVVNGMWHGGKEEPLLPTWLIYPLITRPAKPGAEGVGEWEVAVSR